MSRLCDIKLDKANEDNTVMENTVLATASGIQDKYTFAMIYHLALKNFKMACGQPIVAEDEKNNDLTP